MKIKKLAGLIIILLFCFGCEFWESGSSQEMYTEKRKIAHAVMDKALQDCIDMGGIPIIRFSDYKIGDCKFSPKK